MVNPSSHATVGFEGGASMTTNADPWISPNNRARSTKRSQNYKP